MTGCSGLKVCSSTRPGASARPARPATWCSSCTVRSAARRSPPARPRSASTTPTSVRCGKVPALGDDLRADDEVDLARRDRARRLGRGVRAGQRVARHHQPPRLGEHCRRLLGDALHPRADRRQAVGRAAGRAVGGIGSAWPQWWHCSCRRARCSTSQAVQFGHCIRWPQGAAQRQRRVAPAVEEQHRLLAARERLLHRLDQRRREEPAALRRRLAQVDRRDLGQRAPRHGGSASVRRR